ncbi:MAG: transporter [Clostridia bacterium]|nr:transporter [Clostridia bacterium]
MKKKANIKNIALLEIAFLIYSLSSLCSKWAVYNAQSIWHTLFFYGLSLCMLGIYAIIWQQVLKRMELTVAFSNKGITIVWGILFGMIFFQEKITIGMIIGSVLVIAGIVFMMKEKENQER